MLCRDCARSSSSRWRAGAFAQTPRSGQLGELKQLSIEELVDTDVTTASRRIERLADVAAAVTVITGEDLRRMGVMTLAQALRLAGHLHVSQVPGRSTQSPRAASRSARPTRCWCCIDGRTVYSPVFAGVFWETQDMSLLDIDRIEVIRGPGGSIWGANAVNGVINVISKRAADTKRHARQRLRRDERARPVCRAPRRTPRQRRRVSRVREGAIRGFAPARQRRGCAWTISTSARRASGSNRIRRAGSQIVSRATCIPARPGCRATAEANLVRRQPAGALDASQARITPPASRRISITPTGAFPISIAARSTPSTSMRSINGRPARHNVVFGAGYRRYDGDDFGDGPGFFFEPRERDFAPLQCLRAGRNRPSRAASS